MCGSLAEPRPAGGGHLAVLVAPAAAAERHPGVHDVGKVVGRLGLDKVVPDLDVQGVVQREAGVRLPQLGRLSDIGILFSAINFKIGKLKYLPRSGKMHLLCCPC